ncbi:hypothetical protein HDU81_002495 [Chytriomyces hyalinus]|nr:hypothetical protein HDU81_002495 [Chytriomyces hyalinus]
MSTAPNSRRGSNLDDIMIQQHVHFHRPTMLQQSHEGSFRKMGSQLECAAAMKSLSSLSLSDCPVDETHPLASHNRSSSDNSGVTSTALECIKLNMMGLSMRDETEEEEESNQEYQYSHRHRRSTRPASASPTRRVHTLLQKPVSTRSSNPFSASAPSSYAYDASLSTRRVRDTSWRRRVPRTVCNVGTITTVSFADEDVLMCAATNLSNDHEARLRRRHPYYRPPLVSAMSRRSSEASTIGDLSHALWMRQRE